MCQPVHPTILPYGLVGVGLTEDLDVARNGKTVEIAGLNQASTERDDRLSGQMPTH